MSQRWIMMAATLSVLGACGWAHAADAQAGKTKADKTCGECHAAADWEGEDETALAAKIKAVVSGKTPHAKKIQLTDAEIADIAAFWAAAAKK